MLQGDRKGQYSVRVNDQWRFCFICTEHGPAVSLRWRPSDGVSASVLSPTLWPTIS
ncbi:hypothetical protein AB0T83_19870, partial [Fluviibacterium sp. DFM31]